MGRRAGGLGRPERRDVLERAPSGAGDAGQGGGLVPTFARGVGRGHPDRTRAAGRLEGNELHHPPSGRREVSVLRKDVEELNDTQVSVMPENLLGGLGPQEVADLLEFVKQADGAALAGGRRR
jgi:hypothetical protein